MNTVTYSQVRSNLAKTMDKVCDDHSPIIITRKSQRSVVMISLEDYQARRMVSAHPPHAAHYATLIATLMRPTRAD